MTTNTTQITKQPAITKPQVFKAPASGKAIIAVFPPDKEGGAPVNSIVRFTKGGALRAVSVPMRINPAKGETFGLPTKTGAKTPEGKDEWKTLHSLTALGYDRLNTVAGVTFFTLPERLIDNEGQERPNPWIEQDKHGAIHFVRVAQVGFGRAATGNLVAHALSVTYDLRTYLSQDLWSKWQGKKGWGNKPNVSAKDWGVLTPADVTTPPDKDHTLPFHIPAGVILWVDFKQLEVQSIIGEHINRQKFAERNAITICRRNILKKFFGVSRLDDSMTVQVTGFVQEDRDLMAMGKAVAAAQAGEIVIDGEQVKIEAEDMGVVGEDEIDEALAGEDDEDAVVDGPPDEGVGSDSTSVSPTTGAPVDPNADIRAKIRKLVSDLGEAGDAVLARLEIEGLSEIGRTGSTEMLRDALHALEAEQLKTTQAKASTRGPAKEKGGALFNEPKKPSGGY